MTHNFGAAVTLLLKFHRCVEAIFLIFRVCWEARGMAYGPSLLAKNNARHLFIPVRFGDLRHEQLGTFFSCSAAQPCAIFKKMYGRSCLKRTKFQWR